METPSPCHKFLVTGGGGYIGFHIAKRLIQLKHEVIIFDLNYPTKSWDANLEYPLTTASNDGMEELCCTDGKFKFVKGDIRDSSLLLQVTKNVTCVIHTASYGMSGREQMPPYYNKVEDVNIRGTRNVIEACVFSHCKGLVYTSTYNVVFGGNPIFNGDESLPYYPLHQHPDHYSRTKSIAEQLVLTSNGRGDLQTCALRLAGVFGRGELRHFPRLFDALRKGLLFFNYYDQHGGIVDFIGIENVVQGHVKAALKLADPQRKIPGIGGQPYFLSDGKPIQNMKYFEPIIKHYGRSFPSLRVPMWLMHIFVFFIYLLYCIIYPFADFIPFLTPAELYKTGVTHYFSLEKARRELDYHPIKPNDLSDVVDSLKKLE